MIDDEKRHSLNFEGNYTEFSYTLNLNPESQTLTIKVENSLTMELYEQSIDAAFLQERPALACLVDPANLFDYLVEHSDAIVIEEGRLMFLYVWGKSIKKEKQIAIDTKKCQMSELELAKLKIAKLTNQLLQRDTTIKYHQQKLRNSESLKENLIKKMEKAFQKQRIELKTALMQKQIEIKSLKQALQSEIKGQKKSGQNGLFSASRNSGFLGAPITEAWPLFGSKNKNQPFRIS